jgi:hypothetical protein
MSAVFSGSVYRIGQLQTRRSSTWTVVPAVHEGFILVMGRTDESANHFLTHAFRKSKRWWLTDRYDFVDAPKLHPALLYARNIVNSKPEEQFIREYFDAAPIPGDTNYHNPHGPDPSPRGAPEDRQRELDVLGPVFGLAADDPWRRVESAYEFWWSRALLKLEYGYRETIWFQSTGPNDDPLDALRPALTAYAGSLSGTLARLVGPVRANQMSGPSTGLLVGRASRHLSGGEKEYEAKFVTLDAWRQ